MNIKYQHILTKKFLEIQYLKNKKTIRYIAKQIGCSYCAIRYNLNKYKIQIRNNSEAHIKHGEMLKQHYCIEPNCKNEICYQTWKDGQGRCRSCASKILMQQRDITGKNNGFFDKHHTKESKQKIRNSDYHKNLGKENNPQWIDGRSFEPYPLDWTKIFREQIRERDHYTCQLCRCLENGRKLSIHHIDYDKENLNPDNLTSLCINCHLKTNFNRKHWKKYFKKIKSQR